MAKRFNRDDADREALKRAIGFTVTRYLGRARYEHLGEFEALDDARRAKIAAGRDEHGRPAMIYASVPGRGSIHVE